MEEKNIKIDESKEEKEKIENNSENINKENEKGKEDNEDDFKIEKDDGKDEEVEDYSIDENDEQDEFDENDEIDKDPNDEKLRALNQKLNQLQENVDAQKFARVDSKPEFASEVINIGNNQKVANLEDNEIEELLDKRKFVNLLTNFGWNRLANRILMNVRDVENYSLSEKGMLIKNVMTEQAKTAQYTYEQNKSKSRRDKK